MGARPTNDFRPAPVTGRVWPGAHEATGFVGAASQRRPRPVSAVGTSSTSVAVSRAATKLRRYVCANSLNKFVTLTTATTFETIETLALDVKALLRRMRRRLGRFAYLWVPEAGVHRPHVHLFVDQSAAELVGRLWPAIVKALQLRSIAELRAKAAYVSKDFATPVLSSRYYPARGFQPEYIEIEASSRQDFIDQASVVFGGAQPDHVVDRTRDGFNGLLVASWSDNELESSPDARLDQNFENN